jgi:hypothetical protein
LLIGSAVGVIVAYTAAIVAVSRAFGVSWRWNQ